MKTYLKISYWGQLTVIFALGCLGLSSQAWADESACQPPPAGLVSWWSGDRTADDIQGLNPGELVGSASYKPGMVGPAFVFHEGGLNDYVQVGDSSTLRMTTAMTIECWVYPTGIQDSVFVNKEGEYEFGTQNPNGTLWWAFANTNPGWVSIDTGFVVPLGSWNHVAVTYDNGLITTYANGIQVHQYQGSGSIGDVLPTVNDFRIGNRQQFPAPFPGRIDELKVYNRALSSDEIAAIYAAGSNGTCKPKLLVASIDPSYRVVHSQFLITTSVAVEDTNGIPISGATVKVKTVVPNGSTLIFPAQTDENGNASFSFYTTETGLYNFKVIRLSHPSRDYDPSLNIETADTLVIP